jgi:hypothetical protein
VAGVQFLAVGGEPVARLGLVLVAHRHVRLPVAEQEAPHGGVVAEVARLRRVRHSDLVVRFDHDLVGCGGGRDNRLGRILRARLVLVRVLGSRLAERHVGDVVGERDAEPVEHHRPRRTTARPGRARTQR